MNDLEDRLRRLGDLQPPAVTDSGIARDLELAHRSLVRTRRHRSRVAALSVSALAAASIGGYALSSRSTDAHDTVSGPRPGATRAAHHHLTLVDYEGDQLPGFTVAQVPEGYVLQGAARGVLDIAEAGDTTSLYSFTRKLVITIENRSEVGDPTGTPVTVNGHPGGIFRSGDGVAHLDYVDGDRIVQVQSWSNIDLTDDQLIQFARGITVTSAAEVSHG